MREAHGGRAGRDSYTRYPRPILWLVREGLARIGGSAPDASPSFEIHVPSFYLSKLPVTNRQYEAFDPAHGRNACSSGDDDPVTGVSHEQARAYCAWYAAVSRKPIRLPGEIEWEYACRSGAAGPCVGAQDPAYGDERVWHAGNSGGRLPALRSRRPNRFGLIAMLGGVWEWTASVYRPYPLDGPVSGAAAQADERPPVLRGGSWRVAREAIDCGVRRAAEPGMDLDDVGFRIARSL